ncbi:hypothetical protein KI387_010929, partial [Taxus chinensis]
SGLEIRLLLGYQSRRVESLPSTRLRIGGSRSIAHKGKPYKRFGDAKLRDEDYKKAWGSNGKPHKRFGDGKLGDEEYKKARESKDKPYKRFGDDKPGEKEYKKAWEREMDEATCVWSASDSDDEKLHSEAVKKHYDLSDSDDDNGQE